jgi:outer membrane lipoprotein LolB
VRAVLGFEVRRALVSAVLIVLLSACVTVRPPQPLLTGAEARATLEAITRFRLEGRVAVSTGVDGFNASLNWTQDDRRTAVQLSGPLGAGAMRVSHDGVTLRIASSKGESLEGEAAVAVLEQRLGFTPPLVSLRYWLLALPDPASAALEQRDDNGQLTSLEQAGWLIEYEEYRAQRSSAGGVMLPRRLRATRENLRLRVVVDNWRLPQ